TIIHYRLLEERKPSSVKSAVADEDDRPFGRGGIRRIDSQYRRCPGRDLDRGNEITEWPKIALKSPAGFLHGLGVKPNPRELHEVFAIGAWQINSSGS